jgi:putative RNA 2'-phosphotransferase
VKELLQALHEEPGFGYVRQSHLVEVLAGNGRDLLFAEGNRVRAVEGHWEIKSGAPLPSLPKILFTPVRRKTHPVVMQRGLHAEKGRYLTLSDDEEMAARIGRRRDPKPVVLHVRTTDTVEKGMPLSRFGDLFLASDIPAECISGPSVSAEVLRVHEEKVADKAQIAAVQEAGARFMPGSFFLKVEKDAVLRKRAKGKKPKGWKETARKLRKG